MYQALFSTFGGKTVNKIRKISVLVELLFLLEKSDNKKKKLSMFDDDSCYGGEES